MQLILFDAVGFRAKAARDTAGAWSLERFDNNCDALPAADAGGAEAILFTTGLEGIKQVAGDASAAGS